MKTKGVSTAEWKLRNYLDKHNIYKGNRGMQTIIINSFYNQHNSDQGRENVNDTKWKDKLEYVHKHFGLFAQDVNNTWKDKKEEEV